MFRSGEDIHSALYREVFGRKPKDEKQRKIAKTARYAEVYGTGFPKFLYLLRLSGVAITPAEGKKILGAVRGRFEAIDEYKEELHDRLKDGGVLRNLFGRERTFEPWQFIGEYDKTGVRNMLREAFNWIFQSSGHDITALWTMECMDLIDDKKVLLVDEVHDEFVLDVPPKKVKAVVSAIEFVSNNLNDLVESTFGVKLRVPLTAEVEVGRWWR